MFFRVSHDASRRDEIPGIRIVGKRLVGAILVHAFDLVARGVVDHFAKLSRQCLHEDLRRHRHNSILLIHSRNPIVDILDLRPE